jgi:pyrroloquinoline quinone biosynthesis protein B
MIIKILGASAGGGFPQWNCNCSNCAGVRSGKPGFTARTQSSLAISDNGQDWVLLNASPDLRQQINDNPELGAQASGERRNTPIKAVILTNGDVDHVIGLVNLREAQPLVLYCSNRVLDTVNANSIFNVLNPEKVPRNELQLDTPTDILGPEGSSGLTIEAFDVPGKVALYLEKADAGPGFGTETGDTIGLKVTSNSSGKSFYYVPGCAEIDEPLAKRLKGAPLVFFDGTLFTDDEMLQQGLMPKTGGRMGHMNMSGPNGSMAKFALLDVNRKVYVHINNSNPVLDENSDERRQVEASGWEVGFDGMEIRL